MKEAVESRFYNNYFEARFHLNSSSFVLKSSTFRKLEKTNEILKTNNKMLFITIFLTHIFFIIKNIK